MSSTSDIALGFGLTPIALFFGLTGAGAGQIVDQNRGDGKSRLVTQALFGTACEFFSRLPGYTPFGTQLTALIQPFISGFLGGKPEEHRDFWRALKVSLISGTAPAYVIYTNPLALEGGVAQATLTVSLQTFSYIVARYMDKDPKPVEYQRLEEQLQQV